MVNTKSEIEDEPLTDEPSTAELEQQEPRRSKRQEAATKQIRNWWVCWCSWSWSPTLQCLSSKWAKEHVRSSKKWIRTRMVPAADSEYKSLIENETWELTELHVDCEVIGSKWVFKVKHTIEGKIEWFKGRLVAKGDAQRYGVDYDETFSPVVRFSSVCILIAGGSVSWSSKRQAVVALSTSEAEYIALSLATQEALWIRQLLTELQVPLEPVVLMEDNQRATSVFTMFMKPYKMVLSISTKWNDCWPIY